MYVAPYPQDDPTEVSGYVKPSALSCEAHSLAALRESCLHYDRFGTYCALSYETVLKRWPKILTGIVNQVYCVNHNLTIRLQSSGVDNDTENVQDHIEEGRKLIELFGFLKYRMARDMKMECVSQPFTF
jgi:hypothetical protein